MPNDTLPRCVRLGMVVGLLPGKALVAMTAGLRDRGVPKSLTGWPVGSNRQGSVSVLQNHASLRHRYTQLLQWSPSYVTAPSARLKRSHKKGGGLFSGGYLYQNVRPNTRLWQSRNSRNYLTVVSHNTGTTVSVFLEAPQAPLQQVDFHFHILTTSYLLVHWKVWLWCVEQQNNLVEVEVL